MKFSGKKVLITGAASGIGLAQTKVFLAEGAEVVAVDLQEFTDESIINSKNLSVKILDVSDAQSVEKLADEVGSIDVLLNTAGVLDAYKTLEETDFAEWQRILSTNLNSMYLMISAFL
ncbi:MAG: SDR family NAD(P)-dependent oxidoreductase, partial [Lactococcus lactis]